MGEVRIDSVSVDGGTVTCQVSPSGDLRRFFTGRPFRVEYGVSVESVPASILVVPTLAHVLPVAWTRGADVSVEAVDRTFLSSAHTVRQALCGMYPEFMEGGGIAADRVTELPDRGGEDSAVLFSGGVDSLATYLRHREEDPTLISLHGWVVAHDDEERWERTRAHIESFAESAGSETAYVSSNMLDAIDTPMLHAHFKRYLGGSWYSAVGHGIGLTSLCAPLAYATGLSRLYIAATHSHGFEEPWGSHPTIDNNVAWSGTRCIHDGYEWSRQEKIDRIAGYVEREHADLTLRTCTSDTESTNCGECEKCYRTAVGLLLAGLDPADHGYEFEPAAFETIRERFEEGDWLLAADEQFMWEDLSTHADRNVAVPYDGFDEFSDWLRSADFESYVERAGPPLGDRAIRAVARNTPAPVYDSLYPVYDSVKSRLAR
jgi:hypothetical protein